MRRRSVSIIIPTYGREKELYAFLDSIIKQTYDLHLVELLIVDQNDVIDLSDGLNFFISKLNIKHIKTDIKGISHAKNIGMAAAVNEIFTFADDDSLYYPDTLEKANMCFENRPDVDVFYGKVFDRTTNKNVIRNWKSEALKINKFNYHLNYIAIACFTRIKSINFDERFGVGTNYGVGEELDYLLRSLDENYNVWYTPDIEVWHPELNVFVMSKKKVFYYARGYGAICRKHNSFTMFWNLFVSSSYQVVMLLLLTVSFRFESASRRYLALSGRVKGYLEFRG